jgi:MFS family permease
MDLEKGKQESDREDVEYPQRRPSQQSSRTSIFSESHMEGIRGSTPDLSRVSSRRLEQVTTTASNALSVIRSRKPRPDFSHPLTSQKTAPDVIVDFDGPDDPYRPLNWLFKKKAITTALYGLTTMSTTLGSSIFSPATEQIAADYHVGTEVATLGTALFLFGMGLGPLLWAPLSELYGRKPAVLIPTFIAGIFAFGAGAGKDIQTIIICRFFQGMFGSAPVTNTGGALGDIWNAEQRGAAIVGYAMALVGGPTIGPLIGGACVTSYLRWRWTQYLTGIYTMFILLMDVIFIDESYPAALLVVKARRLRHESGNWALHAKHEEWDVSIREIAHKYLVRPFKLLMTPICFLVALYASFCYGILFATLGAFPVVFQEVRGWNEVVGALPFLATLFGVILGAIPNLLNNKYYIRAMKKNNGKPAPEARLPPMMFGSVSFAIGLFIFAWTAPKEFPWIAPVIGIVLCGIGFFTIFQGALNYLIDTFQKYAASAVAANTFLRSGFAGAFPLFIAQLLHAVGVSWGLSIFGFCAIALIPIPYLFYIYGPRIRARGEWSRESTL